MKKKTTATTTTNPGFRKNAPNGAKAAAVAKTSGATIQQLADRTTAEGRKAVKAAKKSAAKATAKAPRLSSEDRAKRDAKLTARVLTLKADGHSFREIEKRMAKDLGLDPSRAFGGFVAFRLFKAAPKADQTAAAKSAKAAKKTSTKKPAAKAATVETKTALNGAQVIA